DFCPRPNAAISIAGPARPTGRPAGDGGDRPRSGPRGVGSATTAAGADDARPRSRAAVPVAGAAPATGPAAADGGAQRGTETLRGPRNPRRASGRVGRRLRDRGCGAAGRRARPRSGPGATVGPRDGRRYPAVAGRTTWVSRPTGGAAGRDRA